MAALFYHVAVGQFGAECLGRLCWLVQEERIDDPLAHRFLWMGLGARPERGLDKRSYAIPQWDFPQPKLSLPSLNLTELGLGLKLNRSMLAKRVAQSLTDSRAKEGVAVTVRWLLNQYPIQLLGQGDIRPLHVTLCGSLADPADSAIILGWLHAMELLKQRGATVPTTHIVAGIGEASSDLDEPEDVRRAIAARSVFDFQAYFSQGKPVERMAPLYLVGERPVEENVPMDRPTQVALGAYTLLAIAKDLNCPEANRPALGNWPFPVRKTEGQVGWGGTRESYLPYEAECPIALCGGYAVLSPADRLANVLATRFCRDFFRQLAIQRPLGPPDGKFRALFESLIGRTASPKLSEREASVNAPIVDRPADGFPTEEQSMFLREMVGRAAAATWKALGEEAESADRAARLGWPDWKQLEQLVGKASDDKVWMRLMEIYGDDRFLKIPLDDWEQAFSEYETLIEQGFHSRRQRRLQSLKQILPQAVQDGLEQALGDLFSIAVRKSELRLEPHRLAEALWGMGYAHVKQIRDEFEKDRLQFGSQDEITKSRFQQLVADKDALLGKAAEMPSPVAVQCRAGLILAAAIGVALVLPLPKLLAWIPDWMRIAAGVTVGVLFLGEMLRRVYSYKAFLLEGVKQWFSQFSLLVEERDDWERKQAVEEALTATLAHLCLLYAGPVDAPSDSDTKSNQKQPIHEILSHYQQQLTLTAKRFESLESDLLRTFQASRLETYVPNIGPSNSAPVDQEYKEQVGSIMADAPHTLYINLLRDLEESLHARVGHDSAGDEIYCLPYVSVKKSASGQNVTACWRDGWVPPENIAGASHDEFQRRAVLRFLRTLAYQHFLPKMWNKSLEQRLRGLPHHELGDIITRVNARIGPSSVVGGDSGRRVFRMLIESSHSDPIATSFTSHADPDNELGEKRLTLVIQVQMGVKAEDAVFHPNRSNPTNPLGLAWLRHERSPEPALLPCSPVSEDKGS